MITAIAVSIAILIASLLGHISYLATYESEDKANESEWEIF